MVMAVVCANGPGLPVYIREGFAANISESSRAKEIRPGPCRRKNCYEFLEPLSATRRRENLRLQTLANGDVAIYEFQLAISAGNARSTKMGNTLCLRVVKFSFRSTDVPEQLSGTRRGSDSLIRVLGRVTPRAAPLRQRHILAYSHRSFLSRLSGLRHARVQFSNVHARRICISARQRFDEQ